jgi:hypothetical protein
MQLPGEDGAVADVDEAGAIMSLLGNAGDLLKLRAGTIECGTTHDLTMQVGSCGLVSFLAREYTKETEVNKTG